MWYFALIINVFSLIFNCCEIERIGKINKISIISAIFVILNLLVIFGLACI